MRTQPIDDEASHALAKIVSQIRHTDAATEWEQKYGYSLSEIVLPEWERVVLKDE